jgi:hypothetical protein
MLGGFNQALIEKTRMKISSQELCLLPPRMRTNELRILIGGYNQKEKTQQLGLNAIATYLVCFKNSMS